MKIFLAFCALLMSCISARSQCEIDESVISVLQNSSVYKQSVYALLISDYLQADEVKKELKTYFSDEEIASLIHQSGDLSFSWSSIKQLKLSSKNQKVILFSKPVSSKDCKYMILAQSTTNGDRNFLIGLYEKQATSWKVVQWLYKEIE